MDAETLQQLDERPATVWTPVRIVSAVAIGVAIAIGVWTRFSGLGFSSLAADEYYFVSSVRRILATGLPAFESGGYYVRGWLLQYLTAPSVWLSGSAELGVRIPSMVFGLATASAAYLYGRRTIGRPWALALTVMILLSSWEVEFSRFGRMYAGFQFATLAFLVSLHDAIGGARGWRRYLPVLFCFLAAGSHALSIFLMPLLFLPVLLPGRAERLGGRKSIIVYSLASLVPLLLSLAQRQIDFRGMGVEHTRPAEYVSQGGSTVGFPVLPFWDLGSPTASLAAVALLALVVGTVSWLLMRRRPLDEAAVVASACLACAVGHFLLLGGLLGLLLIFRYGLPRTAGEQRAAFRLGLVALAIAVGWVAYVTLLTYGVGSRAWIESTGEVLFSDAVLRAFVWPDPSGSILAAWFVELPKLTWLFAAALAFQLIMKARGPLQDVVRNPAFFVGYVLLTLGMFTPALETTRYTYFVYPVALAMLVLTVRDVAALVPVRARTNLTAGLGVVAALLLFAVGGDFSPRHLASVGSYESTYRTGEFADREPTWYARDDDVATSSFVTEATGPMDIVIVAETPVISHYLGREHTVYLDWRGHRFSNVSRERGTLDIWSNQRLLGTLAEVNDFTRCVQGDVWIVRTQRETRWLDPSAVWRHQLASAESVFQNPDGSQEVLRVSLHRDATCARATDE